MNSDDTFKITITGEEVAHLGMALRTQADRFKSLSLEQGNMGRVETEKHFQSLHERALELVSKFDVIHDHPEPEETPKQVTTTITRPDGSPSHPGDLLRGDNFYVSPDNPNQQVTEEVRERLESEKNARTKMKRNMEETFTYTFTGWEIAHLDVAIREQVEHHQTMALNQTNQESREHFTNVGKGYQELLEKIDRDESTKEVTTTNRNQPITNPWRTASETPTSWPLLFIDRRGGLELMLSNYGRTWACLVEWYGIVKWQAVQLPQDVFGHSVAAGITLD